VDQPCRGVAIPHLGRDLALIRYQKRPRQWRVLAKSAIDRTRSAGADSRKEVDWWLAGADPGCRTLRWRARDGNDGRRRKNQDEANALVPRAKEPDWEQERCNCERDPRGPTESRQQSRNKDEIGFRDEWQPGSDRLLPDPTFSDSLPRNHSREPAIEPRRALDSEGESHSLTDHLAEEGRAGGARKLNHHVLPYRRLIARNHHRLEIARARL